MSSVVSAFALLIITAALYMPTQAQWNEEGQFVGDGTEVGTSFKGNEGPASCTDGYQNWNHSNVYKSIGSWNLFFMKRRQSSNQYRQPNFENERFVDINGDGLTDYLYAYRETNTVGSTSLEESCVYLNNGTGFDKKYQCVATFSGTNYSTVNAYGDCAQ